jgi:hypothetical protein
MGYIAPMNNTTNTEASAVKVSRIVKDCLCLILNLVLSRCEYRAYYQQRNLLGEIEAKKTKLCIWHDRLNDWLTS